MAYVVLESFSNYVDAHIILGRMQDENIDCWLKNENTTTIMPIWTNAIGGIQLMVNEVHVERASELLKTIKEEKRKHMRCPKCGDSDVEYINTMRKPANWLSAAATFFLGDYAVMPEQRFHCFTCGEEWKESEQ